MEHNQVSLKQIAPESVYASVGTFTSTQSLDILCAYLKHNKPFLDHFKDIIFSVNGEQSIIDQIYPKVKQILNATIHIVVSENLGHTFGTFLSDYKIFEYASQLPYNYVWKFSNDVLVDIEILDKIVTKDVGFYYVNNIGYNVFNTYSKEELPNVLLNQQFYYPQTNYYIIKNSIQFLPDENTIIQLRNKYQEIQRTQPNIQPWHAIEGCDCEHMLAKTVEANNLSKEYLLSEYSTNAIVDFIHSEKIHDGSHKNIAYAELGNLCHYHYLGHPVAVLG